MRRLDGRLRNMELCASLKALTWAIFLDATKLKGMEAICFTAKEVLAGIQRLCSRTPLTSRGRRTGPARRLIKADVKPLAALAALDSKLDPASCNLWLLQQRVADLHVCEQRTPCLLLPRRGPPCPAGSRRGPSDSLSLCVWRGGSSRTGAGPGRAKNLVQR